MMIFLFFYLKKPVWWCLHYFIFCYIIFMIRFIDLLTPSELYPQKCYLKKTVYTIKKNIYKSVKYTLTVSSHQTRITRMIYMLSQCKDAKDNPAVLFARMRRREWRKLSGFFFSPEKSELWRISGACSSSDVIMSRGRKSQTTMEDTFIVVECGYPELYIHLPTFTKTGIHFATRLELPGRSPSHDANSRLLCSEFHLF